MAHVESRNRATSNPESRREVLAEIENRGIEDVLLWFTDLEGHLKSFAITRNELEGALDDGMGFDGSSITGFNAIEESDMVAIPDPETFRILPDGQTGRMICDVVTPDGEPYAAGARSSGWRRWASTRSTSGPRLSTSSSRTSTAPRRSTRAATSLRRRSTRR